ncbi:MAG: DUF3618 domain-containing protein [Devosia sp.]
MTYDNKSSADLEREVQAQRDRVEARIGEIKERLSPGQLLDEALSYTKHGGAHFASNLGQQITANPLPAALVGVGLAWLIASQASGQSGGSSAYSGHDDSFDDYPYAKASGIRRVRHAADENGEWWSDFETDSGDLYRARATEKGERAGHFVDKTGRLFAGFIDEAGNGVRRIQDEAGNSLGDAMGWANHSWRDLRHNIGSAFGGARSTARHALGDVASGSRQFGSTVQSQADQMSRQIAGLFDQQPLIGAALAFAAGAALGATLPHTEQEDQLLGREADRVKRKAGKVAGELYEEGKEQAADLYDKATDKASQIYSDAKRQVTGDKPPIAPSTNARH